MLQKSWLRKGKTIIATRTRQWQHDEKGQRRERKKRTMRSRTNPLLLNWIGYYRFSLVSIDRRSYRYEFINNAETEEKVPLMDLRMNLRTDNAPRNWRIMRGFQKAVFALRLRNDLSWVSQVKKTATFLEELPLSREWRSCEGRSYLYSWKIVYWRRRLFQKPNMNIFEWKFTLQE